jgi:hypothetical protein
LRLSSLVLSSGFFNLFKRKDNILEWHLNFGRSAVDITTTSHAQPTEALLISAYLLFVGRYFFICDERQENVVRQALRDEVQNNIDSPTLPLRLFEAANSTLAQGEKEAVRQLFTVGIPPSTFTEGKEPAHSLAKYSFLIFLRNGEPYGNFHMSFGPDIVLLPITLGVLCSFVASKVTGRNKTLLQNGIIALLDLQEEHGSRSMLGMHQQPVDVIRSLHFD